MDPPRVLSFCLFSLVLNIAGVLTRFREQVNYNLLILFIRIYKPVFTEHMCWTPCHVPQIVSLNLILSCFMGGMINITFQIYTTCTKSVREPNSTWVFDREHIPLTMTLRGHGFYLHLHDSQISPGLSPEAQGYIAPTDKLLQVILHKSELMICVVPHISFSDVLLVGNTSIYSFFFFIRKPQTVLFCHSHFPVLSHSLTVSDQFYLLLILNPSPLFHFSCLCSKSGHMKNCKPALP